MFVSSFSDEGLRFRDGDDTVCYGLLVVVYCFGSFSVFVWFLVVQPLLILQPLQIAVTVAFGFVDTVEFLFQQIRYRYAQ